MSASGPPSAPNNSASNFPVVVLCNFQACFAPCKPVVAAVASCVVADCAQRSYSRLLLNSGCICVLWSKWLQSSTCIGWVVGHLCHAWALTASQVSHKPLLVPFNGFAAQGAAAKCL